MLECWTENRFKPIAEVLVSSVETETQETMQAPMLGFEEWFLLGQRRQKNSGLWPSWHNIVLSAPGEISTFKE